MSVVHSAGVVALIEAYLLSIFSGVGSELQIQNASAEELVTFPDPDYPAGLTANVVGSPPAGGLTATQARLTTNTANGNVTTVIGVGTSGQEVTLTRVALLVGEQVDIDPTANPFTQPTGP